MLYVLMGIQASGKSTWARENAARLGAEIVASDEIRNELDAAGVDAEHEGDRVFVICEARVTHWLDAGRTVIADANLNHSSIRPVRLDAHVSLGAAVLDRIADEVAE